MNEPPERHLSRIEQERAMASVVALSLGQIKVFEVSHLAQSNLVRVRTSEGDFRITVTEVTP